MQGCIKSVQSIYYNHEAKQCRKPPTWAVALAALAAVSITYAYYCAPNGLPMKGFNARKVVPMQNTPSLSANTSYMQASLEAGRNVIPTSELASFLDPSRPITENFTQVKELGAGAFGQVGLWKNSAGQQFAIKELRRAWIGDSAQEFAIGLELDHPNIVKAHNFVSKLHEGGTRHYMIMEYIDGKTANQFLHQGNPDPALRLKWADQVLGAFDHMLDRGIVPSDLHFENMMVTKEGDWKFIDLGLYSRVKQANYVPWHLMEMGSLVQNLAGSLSSANIDPIPLFRMGLAGMREMIKQARQPVAAAA